MTLRFNSLDPTATPAGTTNLVTAGAGAAADTLTSVAQIFALFSSAFAVSSSGVATLATVGVAKGGTGLATLTAHALYVGAGASAPTALAVGATNTVLHGNTGADPSFSAVVEADITLADNTTNNVGTTKHGFAPKLPNDATKYLDGTGAYSTPSGGGGMAIGGAVSGGSANDILFVDGTGDLSQSGNLTFVLSGGGSFGILALTGNQTITSKLDVTAPGTYHATLNASGPAGTFADASNNVDLADGTYAINVTGIVSVLGTSGNTYRWNAGTTAPATQTLLTLPLNVYGQGTITNLMGDPDGWVYGIVKVSGVETLVKFPYYLP